MQTYLAARRRLLVLSYNRYVVADRVWKQALNTASELVPDVIGRGYWRLGTSRSRLRKLYIERDRALQKMMVARLKLSEAKRRLAQREKQHLCKGLLVDMR